MTGVQTCALRSEEHTSELQSHDNLVCRLLLEKTKDIETYRACPLPHKLTRALRGPPAPPPQRTPRALGGRAGPTLTQRCGILVFFFNDTATTEIYTFPYTTLFRS